jgi:hypothetical protein
MLTHLRSLVEVTTQHKPKTHTHTHTHNPFADAGSKLSSSAGARIPLVKERAQTAGEIDSILLFVVCCCLLLFTSLIYFIYL